MDLSKLTREELEREATRHRIRDVSHLTRAQLIRAIEAPPPAGAIDAAKAIFRGVLGVARTLRGRASSPPPPPSQPNTPAPGPFARASGSASHPTAASAEGDQAARPTPAGRSAVARRASGDTQRLRVSETPSGLPAVSRPATEAPPGDARPVPAAEATPRPTRGRAEPTRKMKLPALDGPGGAGAAAGPEGADISPPAVDAAAPPAGRDLRATAVTMDLGPLRDELILAHNEAQALEIAAQRREIATTVPIRVPREDSDEEPIPTRTMARLLHEQGHHRRALAILDKLLGHLPGDPELKADVAAVQRALGVAPTPATPGAKVEPSARAELVTMLLPDNRVLLAWGLSDESLSSAKSLGAAGTLVARVLVHAPAGGGAVARSLTDKEVEAAGEWAVGPISSGSFVTAAVGFRDGEQFTSVAAAPVLDVG